MIPIGSVYHNRITQGGVPCRTHDPDWRIDAGDGSAGTDWREVPVWWGPSFKRENRLAECWRDHRVMGQTVMVGLE